MFDALSFFCAWCRQLA